LLCNAADERRWFINPGCIRLIDDLSTRTTDSAGAPTKVKSGDDSGHITDAAGYVVHKLFPINLDAAQMSAIGGGGASIGFGVVR
jgi:hypothetical protein